MKVTGNMINYYFVCHRKLWLFTHGLQYEEEHGNVSLGKSLEKETYKNKRKQVMLDNTVNIDFLEDWQVLHEVKKSRAIEPAAIWQLRYYLYYLQNKGIPVEKGYLDYPKLRQRVEVTLGDEDRVKLTEYLTDIKGIVTQEKAPYAERLAICPACAYFEFCFS